LLRKLCGVVLTVVVDENDRKFPGIILLKKAGYSLADGGSFISRGHKGDDARPRARRFMLRGVVIERTQAPERAAREG